MLPPLLTDANISVAVVRFLPHCYELPYLLALPSPQVLDLENVRHLLQLDRLEGRKESRNNKHFSHSREINYVVKMSSNHFENGYDPRST